MFLKLEWQVDVAAPKETVFDAFVERMWDLLSSGVGVEATSLAGDPISAGSKYVHVAEHSSGRRVEAAVTIEVYDPTDYIELSWSSGEPGHWIWIFGSAGMANLWYDPAWAEEGSRFKIRFEANGDFTSIDARSEHNLKGALVPLSFLLRWSGHWRIKRKLLRFRDSVEGQVQDTRTTA